MLRTFKKINSTASFISPWKTLKARRFPRKMANSCTKKEGWNKANLLSHQQHLQVQMLGCNLKASPTTPPSWGTSLRVWLVEMNLIINGSKLKILAHPLPMQHLDTYTMEVPLIHVEPKRRVVTKALLPQYFCYSHFIFLITPNTKCRLLQSPAVSIYRWNTSTSGHKTVWGVALSPLSVQICCSHWPELGRIYSTKLTPASSVLSELSISTQMLLPKQA